MCARQPERAHRRLGHIVAGTGLHRRQIIETFKRRLANHPDFEFAEALRHIHRIAEIRLNDKFGATPKLGNLVWDWAESLAPTCTLPAGGHMVPLTHGPLVAREMARFAASVPG